MNTKPKLVYPKWFVRPKPKKTKKYNIILYFII